MRLYSPHFKTCWGPDYFLCPDMQNLKIKKGCAFFFTRINTTKWAQQIMAFSSFSAGAAVQRLLQQCDQYCCGASVSWELARQWWLHTGKNMMMLLCIWIQLFFFFYFFFFWLNQRSLEVPNDCLSLELVSTAIQCNDLVEGLWGQSIALVCGTLKYNLSSWLWISL